MTPDEGTAWAVETWAQCQKDGVFPLDTGTFEITEPLSNLFEMFRLQTHKAELGDEWEASIRRSLKGLGEHDAVENGITHLGQIFAPNFWTSERGSFALSIYARGEFKRLEQTAAV